MERFSEDVAVEEAINVLESLRINLIFSQTMEWEEINRSQEMTALYLMAQADIQKASSTLRLLAVKLKEKFDA